MSDQDYDLEFSFASAFASVCKELEVDPKTILKKAILCIDCFNKPSDDDQLAPGQAKHLIRTIDGSGKTTMIPQASLYPSLRATSKM